MAAVYFPPRANPRSSGKNTTVTLGDIYETSPM
jgi:hypothetical protein